MWEQASYRNFTLPNRTQEIIAFGYKGSVKFRYDACSHITISTPFDSLLEKLFFYITSKEHTVTEFTHATKSHTEVEIISDTVPKILCVWTLASYNQKISSLSAEHDNFL